MAQKVQIVPKFLHSHVETVINDYTAVVDTARVESDDSCVLLTVFTGPQGIDNTLVKIKDTDTFESIFGKSNYRLYGQPMMMAEAALRTGCATCWCMRVMPDDARYANSVLSVYYKADVAKKKFRIKFKAKSLTDTSAVTSKTDLYTKGLVLDGVAGTDGTFKDADGYTQVPLVTFRASGRGDYANNYRWRMIRNRDSENDYRIKMISFEALNSNNGIKVIANYAGTLADSDKFAKTTLINDIVDDADTGVAPIDIQCYEDNFITLHEAYVKFLKAVETATPGTVTTIPDADEFDPIFGYELGTANKDKFISFTQVKPGSGVPAGGDADDYTDTKDIITPDSVEGVLLAGGTDGSFKSADQTARDNAINKAYNDAFSGKLDKMILSNKRVHLNAIFDANYPYEVKKTLYDFATTRDDSVLYLDCGLINSFSEGNMANLERDYGIFNNRGCSKNPQWMTIKDPITRKKVPVTITYFFAERYPIHVRDNGYHVPFTNNYAQLSNGVRNSLQPVVEDYDTGLKEWLYVNRFNYFEATGEDVYKRSCQNTSQMLTSDLLEESNMHTLFSIKHILETDARNNLYNFAEADDRKRFTDYETAKFAPWVGSRLQSFNIEFSMNAWEAERSIMHCYVAIQFRTLNKRTIIEIDVNKRDFTA